MKKILYLSILVLLFAVLASCGQAETTPPDPPEVPPTPTEGVQVAVLEDILDITWQWTNLVESEPASQSMVPNPEDYTLVFRGDGTLEIQADCNMVQGTYFQEGSALIVELGASTMAACGEDSLDQLYLATLDQVNSFGMQAGQLKLSGENFTMSFNDGGTAESVDFGITKR